MKIPKGIRKLDKIVSDDETRFALMNPAVVKIKDDHYLAATDGWKMLAVKVEMEEGDTPGYIPLAALNAATKATPKYEREVHLSANGSVEVVDGENKLSFARNPDSATFPNVSQIVPTYGKTETVTFNAYFLAELAKAAGSYNGNVTLEYERDSNGRITKPITVEVSGAPSHIALLMSVRRGA